MKTQADFFKAIQDKTILKTVTGVATDENWPDIIESVTQQIIDQGGSESDIEVTDDKLTIRSTNQFILRPKLKARELGKLVTMSKKYYFMPENSDNKIYGEKKGLKVIDNKGVKQYDNGMTITFEIID